MKALILDIDGVLNTTSDFFEVAKYGHPHNHGQVVLNRSKLAILQTVIENTGAVIVLSSTWRWHFSLEEMHEMFTERGWTLGFDVWYGITPSRSNRNHPYAGRGIEIAEYLEKSPEIESYVILDDRCDEIEEAGFEPVSVEAYQVTGDFIEVNEESGITPMQGIHASWALGLTPKAKAREEQRRKDLDLLMSCAC